MTWFRTNISTLGLFFIGRMSIFLLTLMGGTTSSVSSEEFEVEVNCTRRVEWSEKELQHVNLEQLQQSTSSPEIDTLQLDRNELSSLHLPEWSPLHTLRDFSVGANQLAEFPMGLEQCPQLEYLDVSANRIASVDNVCWEKWPKLRTCQLQQNQLTHLPSTLFQLPALRLLALHSNQFEQWPEHFSSVSLRELYLDHNHLTVLPESVTQLQGLLTLDVSYNSITC